MAQLHKYQGLNVFWANFSQFDETISKEKISMEVSGPTLLFALRASRTWHLASGCGKGTCTVPEQPPPQLSTSGTQEPAKAILKDVEGKTRALHAYLWTHLGDLMEIYQSTHRNYFGIQETDKIKQGLSCWYSVWCGTCTRNIILFLGLCWPLQNSNLQKQDICTEHPLGQRCSDQEEILES